mgnify:CR=1 FL=1
MHQGTYPGDPRIAATFLTVHRDRGGNNKPEPKAQVGDQPSANIRYIIILILLIQFRQVKKW